MNAQSLWVGVAVAAVALAAAPSARADHSGKVPWRKPDAGFQEAKLSGKPIMIAFSAEW